MLHIVDYEAILTSSQFVLRNYKSNTYNIRVEPIPDCVCLFMHCKGAGFLLHLLFCSTSNIQLCSHFLGQITVLD
jgi:hypothetical protein